MLVPSPLRIFTQFRKRFKVFLYVVGAILVFNWQEKRHSRSDFELNNLDFVVVIHSADRWNVATSLLPHWGTSLSLRWCACTSCMILGGGGIQVGCKRSWLGSLPAGRRSSLEPPVPPPLPPCSKGVAGWGGGLCSNPPRAHAPIDRSPPQHHTPSASACRSVRAIQPLWRWTAAEYILKIHWTGDAESYREYSF